LIQGHIDFTHYTDFRKYGVNSKKIAMKEPTRENEKEMRYGNSDSEE
jgi:hypothetical protein